MSRARTATLAAAMLLAWLVAGACRSEAPAAPEPAPEVEDTQAVVETPAPARKSVRMFDRDGALLPSDEFIAGVQMPRGIELFRRAGKVHVYRTRVPTETVLRYFGPILITGKVERRGTGALYRQASVRGAEINPTKVDVSITDTGNGWTRISVTELPPTPAYAPPEDETRLRAREEFQRLD